MSEELYKTALRLACEDIEMASHTDRRIFYKHFLQLAEEQIKPKELRVEVKINRHPNGLYCVSRQHYGEQSHIVQADVDLEIALRLAEAELSRQKEETK